MLALLVFLTRLAEYTQRHEPWEGIIATVSKSIIGTVKGTPRTLQAPSHSAPYQRPINPLSPEWDVVIGIQHLLNAMPVMQLQHIKGNQDKNNDFHRLPLLAQLNVEADELANRYQRELGMHEPAVLMARWAGAHLVLPEGTVTSHYEAALRYHASAEPLRIHLRERNQWSKQTFDTINWTVHSEAHVQTHAHHQIGAWNPSNKLQSP
jgi:hypothetical protein